MLANPSVCQQIVGSCLNWVGDVYGDDCGLAGICGPVRRCVPSMKSSGWGNSSCLTPIKDARRRAKRAGKTGVSLVWEQVGHSKGREGGFESKTFWYH
jgi:hypothetical protein